MNKKNMVISMMAFATGKEQNETPASKKVIGIATGNIVAVNPTKTQLEELYGTTLEKEPEYITKDENGVRTVRLSFIFKGIDKKNNNIPILTPINFFLSEEVRVGSVKGKFQIIDAYGQFGWVTGEEFDLGKLPEKSFMKPVDIRKAYHGEEDLVKFMKRFLGIPNLEITKANGEIIKNKPEECMAQFSKEMFNDLFNNKFDYLRNLIMSKPMNTISYPFGVKIKDGKEYQVVYTKMPLWPTFNKFSKLEEDIQLTQDNMGFPNTDFGKAPFTLKIYEAEASEPEVNIQAAPTPATWGFGG